MEGNAAREGNTGAGGSVLSPSMMQERARKPANVSTMSGKRPVRSLPGRLKSRTRGPSLRAIILKPSCLISCSHAPPEGSVSALVGRQGATTKPAGKVRCNMFD